MQILSKKMIIPMAAIAIIGAGTYGASQIAAASDTANPGQSLVQKLADTFHLDKSKVQAVFDQNRADHQANRETNYEARLTKAVTDGKLTAAQKDLVLTEHKKLEAELQAATTGSATEHHAAMQKVRQEAQTWSTQNNIDQKWLIGPGRLHGGRGMGPMMGQGRSDVDSTSPSASPAF